MICTCGIYAVVCKGVLNAPFVAINDEQAMNICAQAFMGSNISADDFELDRLGTLHFEEGIIDVDRYTVTGFSSSAFIQLLDDLEEVDSNDV